MTQEEDKREKESNWERFYEWLEGREPRPILFEAVALFDADHGGSSRLQTIDLGFGDGTETIALLEAGWRVLAVDSTPAAINYVQSKVAEEHRAQLETRIGSFEDVILPESDLIYAGYSLPFCRPEHFDRLWENIAASLRSGGRFAGQLFGDRDDWSDKPELTFHSLDQINDLFAAGYLIESLNEIDEDGEALSGPKHWHVFDIIARRLDD